MDYVAARTRAKAAEDALNLQDPVSLESTHRHLEKLRNRKILIQPMDGPITDKVCGLWFGLDHMDLILHARAVSEVHRQQIVLHEFAHMILRHKQETLTPDFARKFFPDLDPNRVVKALKRTDFMDELEVTAELLADRLASRIRLSQERSGGQPENFGSVFG
ncbi:hypothetical protein ACQCSX_22085 (plasmid) [Pseudarthrobacter sp. P1]|uniref:hypothetical protein n=1 Tax=Pseudarthrobacter sp. P1 TaxID=3418418 RepID=UPI003CEBCC96